MKLNKIIFTILLSCLSIALCSAMTPEEQSQLNRVLYKAIDRGDLGGVTSVLTVGADAHADGGEALHCAAFCGRWAIVACLLQHGAPKMILTPQLLEALRNSTQAQEYVLSEIHTAWERNDLQEVKNLLDIIPLHRYYVLSEIYTAWERNDLQEVKNLLDIIPLHQYLGAKIYIALQRRNLGELQELLNILPFDYLPEYIQIQIREFIQQRALHGVPARKTKYS